MRFRTLTLTLMIALTGVAGWLRSADAGRVQSQRRAEVTFNKDVAPIFFQHCVSCHRPGEAAPMSLLTYREARPWARAIREKVVTRQMPPWHADPRVNEFVNDRRLGQKEIATIVAWADQGAVEGAPQDLPPQPRFVEGWRAGEPDVVIALPEEFTVPAEGPDEYHYFDTPTNFTEDKWVQAAEVKPGNRKAVHHATVFVVPPKQPIKESAGSTTKIDPDSWKKYVYDSGHLLHLLPETPIYDDGCSLPEGGNWPGLKPDEGPQVGVYLPGKGPDIRPPGYAVKVPAGASLRFQVHYTKTGQPEKDRTRIGLVFAKGPVKRQVKRVEIWNNLFKIPPFAGNHRVTSCYTFDHAVEALSFTAHMHYRGKDMKVEAFYPDGRREVVFSAPNYSFNWQTTYVLKRSHPFPKGTRIFTVAHFDNSAKNKLNPDPSKTIRWGEPSGEEMMGLWIEYVDARLSLGGNR